MTYLLGPTLALALVVLLWENLANAGRLDPLIFPAPSEIVAAGQRSVASGELVEHLGATSLALATSFALAVTAGGILSVIIGRSRSLYDLLYPGIAAFYSLPKVAVFPIFMLLFGFGLTQRTLYGAFFGVFPILVNGIAGIQDLDAKFVWLGRSLGMSRIAFWRKIVLPGMLPIFATGMRLGVVYCGVGVLLSEMFVSTRGIGQVMVATAGSIRMATYFFYTAATFALFMGVTGALSLWESRLSRWRIPQ